MKRLIAVLAVLTLLATPVLAGGYARTTTVTIVAPQPVTYAATTYLDSLRLAGGSYLATVPTIVVDPAAYLPAATGYVAASTSACASGVCPTAATVSNYNYGYQAQSLPVQAIQAAVDPCPQTTYVPTVSLPQTAGYTGGYTVQYTQQLDPVATLVYPVSSVTSYQNYAGYSGGYSGYVSNGFVGTGYPGGFINNGFVGTGGGYYRHSGFSGFGGAGYHRAVQGQFFRGRGY